MRVRMSPGGPEVSRLAYGAWRLLEDGQGADVQRVLTLIETCLDCGITTVDHADIYGGYRVEEAFGAALRARPGLRQRLELDFARANMLDVADGQLTGALVPRPWGEVVDGAEKRRVLLEVAELMGIAPAQTIAVGDGANDLPMMAAAGLSIAFHPKPAVREQAMLSITEGGMDRALKVLRAG